jgi:hypothetical protein
MLASGAYSERVPATAEPTTADLLFVELDQRSIEGLQNEVEVLGIHVVENRGTWVQLGLAGESTQAFILHLAVGATVDEAIDALRVWGRTPPASRPRIIEVAPPTSPLSLLSR